ncbi:CdaR family protein [Aquimarina intermedia]|uniref:YbbR-like protein n=1 Tax=Aquimarina intermedia TaxID=350814 RepID=A0A5S5C1F5_9FLAO|nr:CdaR family protein [Aquimarina intermedia]TYP72266.1 YbbR-like protein [Aquimarina intermedia]
MNRFSFKRNNVKVFLFFLVATSILWLFIQFSKNYTRTLEADIVYINIPDDKAIDPTSDAKLLVTLGGNGFRLIAHSWTTPELVFDYKESAKKRSNEYVFALDKKGDFIKRKLEFKGNVIDLQKDTVFLKLHTIFDKKVPVRPNVSLKYAAGYGSSEGLEIQPDSIMLSGIKQVLDSINYVVTTSLTVDGLKSNWEEEVPIKMDSLQEVVNVVPRIINASVSVSKFTEGSQNVPIILENVPENEEVKIFPKEVKIVYRVGLDKYDDISERDFKVIADYREASENNAFLFLKLIKSPEKIHDVRLQEKQIQFVIVNKE